MFEYPLILYLIINFYKLLKFYTVICQLLQIFINPNSQILCVEGFKISLKIYSKNYLKLKIFKA